MISKISTQLSLLIALACFVASGCAHKGGVTDKDTVSYFGSTKVQRFKLKNGLKLLVLEDHSAPTLAYQTWYSVGSIDEEVGLTGLAHLFEHMMFKATKNQGEGMFDRLLEAAGAEGKNAFTSKDYTAYVQNLPSSQLDLIASLESDRMVNLIVNDAALDKEREVVQNERRMRYENSPDGTLFEKLYEKTFTTHPYHWPVIGYEQDLVRAKSKECTDFYKKHYAPNNATVVVVGDVNASTVLSVIEKYYGSLPASKLEHKTVAPDAPQTAERTETVPISISVEKVFLAYRGVSATDKDMATLEVIRNLLTTGKSSRLYKRLVDAGFATTAEAYNPELKSPGFFALFINLQKGKSSRAMLTALDSEIKKIANGQVKTEELERAISLHRFAFFDQQVSNEKKAEFLGSYETVTGNFENGMALLESMKKVTVKDVQRVAQKYLQKKFRTVIFGVPKQSIAKGE